MTATIPFQPHAATKRARTAGKNNDGENGLPDRLVEIWEKGYAQLPSMANRIFLVPFRVGSWYYHYAQTSGPTGIAGIPRLARLAGIEPIAIGNRIGLIYGPEYYGRDVAPAINASAGFIFTLYAYFGQAGIWLIMALVALMDLFLILIVRFAPPLNTIFLAFMTIICLNLMQSDIGYLMYSGGLLPAAAIMVFLHLTTKSAGDRESGNPGKPSL